MTGVQWGILPLEELLFFIVVPIAGILSLRRCVRCGAGPRGRAAVTYTQIAVMAVAIALVLDLGLRTRLITPEGVLGLLRDHPVLPVWCPTACSPPAAPCIDGDVIIGSSSPVAPAPVHRRWSHRFRAGEDLLFGFAMIPGCRRCGSSGAAGGVQREPMSGPPMGAGFFVGLGRCPTVWTSA